MVIGFGHAVLRHKCEIHGLNSFLFRARKALVKCFRFAPFISLPVNRYFELLVHNRLVMCKIGV
jgi:hypothetical protein